MRRRDLPSTLQRSDTKAQDTFLAAHDSAEAQYEDDQRANRVAWAAVKQTHEKVGDRWRPSAEADSGSEAGVDEHATKEHLLELARELDVRGRSRMTKAELAEAIRKANDAATARAR